MRFLLSWKNQADQIFPTFIIEHMPPGLVGLIVAAIILLITFGGPILNLWFKPVFILYVLASNTVFPFLIPSPWTMGT